MVTGMLFVDKPAGLTSHDVVARTRRALGTRKVGHAGTLDPMATGLLTLGVGASTRLLTYLVGLDKQYETTILLGWGTSTDDAEGEPLDPRALRESLAAITDGELAAAVARLTGPIEQVPSAVSAIKVDGRRAYDRVRAGEEVTLKARAVTISAFDVLAVRRELDGDTPHLSIDARIDCSSGTYIRALARDLGTDLGVGGHLTALRRTRVGPFSVADSVTVDALDTAGESGQATDALASSAVVAQTLFPALHLSTEQSRDVVHGKKLDLPDTPDTATAAALDPEGRLLALLSVTAGRGRILVGFPQEG